MEGIWLVSYVALWLFVVSETLLIIALIRHIGQLRLWLQQVGVLNNTKAIVEEGPPIGSRLPELLEILKNELKTNGELVEYKAAIVIFVPAGMWGCDDLTLSLKAFEEDISGSIQTILVSFTPSVADQFEILKYRGVRAPVIYSNGWKIAEICKVITVPYALLVDDIGTVKAKGPVGNKQGLDDLVSICQ